MPTIPSIRTSVENKNVLVLDEHAKNGTFRRDARGRLIAYTGGFSVVFPYEASDGTKWAFRCWHSDINNTQKRYEIISEAIQNARLDFLCGFEYIEKGINVEGNIFPTTRMRWIDGVTIKDYICQNKDSKKLLLDLAENFLKMTNELHKQSLAHGDLQHGNILVDKNHHLFLVDYDSFYCPQLKGEADTVTGLPDYQHPARLTNKTVSEKLDYFSELVIYLSILAIAKDPSLVETYKVEDADRLLFAKEDYEDIKNSKIYRDIKSLGDSCKDLLDVLVDYLKHNNIDDLRPFYEQILDKKITFKSSATKAIRGEQPIKIMWQVILDADVTLQNESSVIGEGIQGSIDVVLDDDTEYELIIVTKDGVRIVKSIKIRVFDECSIDFSSNKEFVFPTLPVVLKWNVTNATKVWLGAEEVESSGSKIVEPTSDVVYKLKAQDEFGLKEKRILIRTIPIKQKRLLLASPPNYVHKQTLTIIQPKLNVSIGFPHINIDWIQFKVPLVKSFKDFGYNVELSQPLPSVEFNLSKIIKKIVNSIIR